VTTAVHVLGISGSLREKSYNTGLLRAAAELLPEGMTLETFGLAPIPLFRQELADAGGDAIPAPVRELKARIAAADALLIATPEYNYSIPGVLKNAIDWASRPVAECPLSDMPMAMMGAGGVAGTVRAQLHLRQVAVYINLLPLNKPEVIIQRAWEKFDADGNLTDERSRQQVQALLAALAAWTRRLRGETRT
jgi:chromate reductase, NAD(P)H dehydrogenase (quinone)